MRRAILKRFSFSSSFMKRSMSFPISRIALQISRLNKEDRFIEKNVFNQHKKHHQYINVFLLHIIAASSF